jgi:hypothetical protein
MAGSMPTPVASWPMRAMGATEAEKLMTKGLGPLSNSICVRCGGSAFAVATTGSTRSGVSPCHHFIRCGLTIQPANTSNRSNTSQANRCCSHCRPSSKNAPAMRNQPGGRQEPMTPRATGRRKPSTRPSPVRSTSLKDASFRLAS